jgi:hypothetical protein
MWKTADSFVADVEEGEVVVRSESEQFQEELIQV